MTSKQTIKFAKAAVSSYGPFGRAYWYTFNHKTGKATRRAGATLVRKGS